MSIIALVLQVPVSLRTLFFDSPDSPVINYISVVPADCIQSERLGLSETHTLHGRQITRRSGWCEHGQDRTFEAAQILSWFFIMSKQTRFSNACQFKLATSACDFKGCLLMGRRCSRWLLSCSQTEDGDCGHPTAASQTTPSILNSEILQAPLLESCE
jgi:hypothetical protein